MIVVVASAYDPRARVVVALWGPHCATLLSAEDLSRPGWAFEVPAQGGARCVANGRVVPVEDITGILTLRPRVFPQELAHVAAADRDYVASEMTAVLLAWLAGQRCPVANRPSARSLAGPDWPASRWRWEAASLGIPTAWSTDEPAPAEVATICGQSFGADDDSLQARTSALARAAGCDLLGVRYSSAGAFVSATPWPALTRPEVRDALQARLR